MKVKIGSRPPWVGLGAAIWVQVAGGNSYTFPLYSHALKSVLGFNQQQLTMLGVANDIGQNMGLIPGIVCNKFPPWVVLLIGNLLCFLGYAVLWLAVSKTVESIPYWLLWFALVVATNSSAWYGTGVLVTNMRNFPLSRGTVAGILKGYGGLSAAVYTEILTATLHNCATNFLLFLSIGIPIICFAVMYFVRPCIPASGEDNSEHCHFLFTQSSSFLLGIYLLTTTIFNGLTPVNSLLPYAFVGVMVLFLLAPLAVPLKMTIFPSPFKQSGSSLASTQGSVDDFISEPLLVSSSMENLENLNESEDSNDVNILLAEGERAVKKRRPKRGEDFKFLQAVLKADFWLLFLVYFLGVGSGVTVHNNLAQIGIAQGMNDTSILLSLFSFCDFLGRLGGGAISEYFVRSRAIPRTIWMTFTQVIMILTFLLFASSLNGKLIVSIALLGICYGVQFSTMVPTASELFGLKHFGIIYNFLLLGNPLGAFLFSGLLAGYVYDKEASSQNQILVGSNGSCLGPHCFRLTFLVLAGVSLLGSVLGTILTFRIRPVYQMLYAGGSFRLPNSSNH